MRNCAHSLRYCHSGVCLKCKREAKRRIHRETLEYLGGSR